MLLGIAYFPPISYFALIAEGMRIPSAIDFKSGSEIIPSVVYIEALENYQKQSWRNRCRYYAADGPAYLNFPIVHEGTHELPIKDIKVDYSTPWVVRTERAISSSYESSAFFDYYKDELFGILESEPETLFELDMRIIRFFLAKIGIAADLRMTAEYIPPVRGKADATAGEYGADYREILHPKRPDNILKERGLEKPYFQVFARKHGFIPNLSIMDLLFNEGPDSILYLTRTSSR